VHQCSYDDLMAAALVIAPHTRAWRDRAVRSCHLPGSGGVGPDIERADPRLGG
jgi:hypothetical protein